jgi:hypothetical protein
MKITQEMDIFNVNTPCPLLPRRGEHDGFTLLPRMDEPDGFPLLPRMDEPDGFPLLPRGGQGVLSDIYPYKKRNSFFSNLHCHLFFVLKSEIVSLAFKKKSILQFFQIFCNSVKYCFLIILFLLSNNYIYSQQLRSEGKIKNNGRIIIKGNAVISQDSINGIIEFNKDDQSFNQYIPQILLRKSDIEGINP